MLSDQNFKAVLLYDNQHTCKIGSHNINKYISYF